MTKHTRRPKRASHGAATALKTTLLNLVHRADTLLNQTVELVQLSTIDPSYTERSQRLHQAIENLRVDVRAVEVQLNELESDVKRPSHQVHDFETKYLAIVDTLQKIDALLDDDAAEEPSKPLRSSTPPLPVSVGRAELLSGPTPAPPVRPIDALTTESLHQMQSLAYQEQDATLDALSATLTRQKHIALDMNDELETQNQQLDELDDELTQAQTTVDRARSRLTQVMQQVTGSSRGCYLVLFLIVILVLLVVIF